MPGWMTKQINDLTGRNKKNAYRKFKVNIHRIRKCKITFRM